MPLGKKRRRRLGGGALLLTLLGLLGAGAASASAAAPTIAEVWTSATFSSSVRLQGQVNPNGLATAYHFDYIAAAAYDANLAAAKDPFTGTARIPASNSGVGSGAAPVNVLQPLSGLTADTAYRYRLVATNSTGTATSTTHTFITQSIGGASTLLDSRGWELVSPVDKNGGQVDPPGAIAAGGVLQAAAQGGAVTYGSAASFAAGAQGAPPASQYLSLRTPGGWSTQNITAPLFSASYNTQTEGVPYQLFSADLGRGLLLNGRHCRGEGSGCAVPNPPLAGTDAPAGYQDYYLRNNASSGFTALLGNANASFLTLAPADFELRLASASSDLNHVVLSTCAALSANATEVPLGEGCDPAQTNLYRYAPGAGLTLVNLKPAQTQGSPGAALAAQAGAISADGSHVYFTLAGDLYLREGATTKQVDEAAGGGGTFETAAADGATAFYTKAAHLYRYQAAGAGQSTDLTPSGGVVGVLGASATGEDVYYQDATALRRWHNGTTTTVAPGAGATLPGDYPPASGSARVSAAGAQLLFLSDASLSGYDNKQVGEKTSCDREAPLEKGQPCSEVFLYDAGAPTPLTCVSCNPTLGRPLGPSSIPGAIANGSAPGSTQLYKPRVLAADGRRVFFDSADAIALTDNNNDQDAYEWEAQGEGSCTRAGGCLALISSGHSPDGASFIDASADGADAYFLGADSLVGADPGGLDAYDARIGGGFAEPAPPLGCEGDNCQSLPPEPFDPTLTTLLSGPGNPPVRYPDSKRCKRHYVRRKGKCVKRKTHHKTQPQSHKPRSGR